MQIRSRRITRRTSSLPSTRAPTAPVSTRVASLPVISSRWADWTALSSCSTLKPKESCAGSKGTSRPSRPSGQSRFLHRILELSEQLRFAFCSWSRNSRYLLTASRDWNAIIWDLSASSLNSKNGGNGERRDTIRFDAPITSANLHPRNRYAFSCVSQHYVLFRGRDNGN